MVINRKYRYSFTLIVALSIVGCAGSTGLNNVGNSMPDGWSVMVSNESGVCASIDGDYQVLGLGRDSEGASLIQTRLDTALGHTFPTSEIPKQVKIMVNKETNTLKLDFGDPVNRSFSETVSCSQGWYLLEQKQSDLYIGDGTSLDHLHRNVELAKATDGSLIVHLMGEAQFSSFIVHKSREESEIWSKYELSVRN
jgi:hypothetical protein